MRPEAPFRSTVGRAIASTARSRGRETCWVATTRRARHRSVHNSDRCVDADSRFGFACEVRGVEATSGLRSENGSSDSVRISAVRVVCLVHCNVAISLSRNDAQHLMKGSSISDQANMQCTCTCAIEPSRVARAATSGWRASWCGEAVMDRLAEEFDIESSMAATARASSIGRSCAARAAAAAASRSRSAADALNSSITGVAMLLATLHWSRSDSRAVRIVATRSASSEAAFTCAFSQATACLSTASALIAACRSARRTSASSSAAV
eukprot:scaffold289103_cov35-Tisochrysis_lutea.AAC.5